MPFQMTTKLKTWLIGLAAFGLTGCGGSGSSGELLGFFSTGQVAPQIGNATVGFYAASRFAEQVSLGATPALVEEIGCRFESQIQDHRLHQIRLPQLLHKPQQEH